MKKLKFAFRITHIDNIPHILKFGLVRAASPNRADNYVSIGDNQVIDRRKDIVVSNVRLGDCVPFYLGPRSPMLYVIQNGYNGVKRRKPTEIVYCVVLLSDIIRDNIDCIFTDGHALSYLTMYYSKTDLCNIDNIINYNDVYAVQWKENETDTDIKRRKEAELLVKDDLPACYIRGFVVYDNYAKEELMVQGVAENMIAVRPNFYF